MTTQGTTENNAALMKKLEALLRLADKNSGATVAEAALAMEKAMEIAMLHNVDLGLVQPGAAETRAQEISMDRYQYAPGTGVITWREYILSMVCRYNLCKVVFYAKTVDCALIGTASNIEIVKYTYECLIDRFVAAWQTVKKQYKPANMSKFNAFMLGALRVVEERLAAKRAGYVIADGDVNAMIVRTDTALEDAMRKFFPNLGAGHSVQINDRRAYNDGMAAARAMEIDPGLKKGESALALA